MRRREETLRRDLIYQGPKRLVARGPCACLQVASGREFELDALKWHGKLSRKLRDDVDFGARFGAEAMIDA